jgi:hypothetical protein
VHLEDVWGSVDMLPRILILGIKTIGQFHASSALSLEKEPSISIVLDWPQSRSDASKREMFASAGNSTWVVQPVA